MLLNEALFDSLGSDSTFVAMNLLYPHAAQIGTMMTTRSYRPPCVHEGLVVAFR